MLTSDKEMPASPTEMPASDKEMLASPTETPHVAGNGLFPGGYTSAARARAVSLAAR